jgi:hypothetical protein
MGGSLARTAGLSIDVQHGRNRAASSVLNLATEPYRFSTHLPIRLMRVGRVGG